MRQIIRSLYHLTLQEKDNSTLNYIHVKRDVFQNLTKQESDILDWLMDFYINNREAPSYDTVHRHSINNFQTETTVFLEETRNETPWYDSDFTHNLNVEYEKQKRFFLNFKLQEASDMLRDKNPADDVLSFLHSSIQLVDTNGYVKPAHIEDTVDEMAEVLDERYRKWKEGEELLKTGYDCLDEYIGGFKKGQFVLLAGFVNHMKSTLMLNMIVNMIVESKQNVILFSSEMPREEILIMLGCIHSGNYKFVRDLGIESVSAHNIMTGRREGDEHDRWNDAWKDLTSNSGYGKLTIYDSSKFRTWGDIKAITTREHLKQPVDVLWMDYLTRLPPDRAYGNQDDVTSRNEMLIDAKRFALSFFNGEGLLVMTPFQVNRKGYISAKGNHGKMDPTALAQYNAAEKEADVIFTVFYDEEESKLEKPKLGIIKSRYSKKAYDTFELIVDSRSRKIYNPEFGIDGITQATPQGNIIVADTGSENVDLGFDPKPISKPRAEVIEAIGELDE